MFNEEPTIEEYDFEIHAKYQEDNQDDYVYEAVSDHVSPTNIFDPVVFGDDSKPVNVVVPSVMSDFLSKKEIVDSSIEATIVAENEQQPLDSSIKETATCSPPQNQKTKSLREIYEQTPVIDEHLLYALFSCQPTFFEEVLKVAQWLQVNE